MINLSIFVMLALLLALAVFAHWRGGTELLARGFQDGWSMLLRFMPIIVISFLAAGFAEVLIPREWVRDTLGADSGVKGILIATAAGVITPSGPFVSMPIAAVMIRSGAAAGPIVAFLAGWSLLAVYRLVAWEIPILGWRFAALRYGVCLVLPVLAGLFARAVTRWY